MNGTPRRSLARGRQLEASKGGNATASRRHKPDYWILVLTSLLLGIGLVIVYSISPGLAASQQVSQSYFIVKQLVDVGLGLIAFGIAASLPIQFWQRISRPLVIAAVVGSVLVMFMPTDTIYQAHRWIRFGGFSFQVAEIIKLALLVWAAGFLTAQWRAGKLADTKETLRPIVFVVLAVGVVVAKLQSDLGSAAVMVVMLALMAFTVGIPLKKIALISGVVLMLTTAAIASSPYRRERLTTFLHPETNCLDSGYQACQALTSIGSGGVFGLGLGYGVQAYGYLPEASDDSIFAIMAEKLGFVGTTVIIAIYGIFIARLKRIIERSSDQFMRLMAVGVLAWLSTQMIINIGAMTGLLPLKGITLPLISQGGTSLVFLTAALGLVFQISRYTSYNVTEPKPTATNGSSNYSFDGRGVRRPHHPSIVARPRS